MAERSLEELATQHVLLDEMRPGLLMTPEYSDHMHQIHVVYHQMIRRFGFDAASDALDQAHATYKLLYQGY